MKTLRELGEGGFIALLKRRLPRGRDVLVGIGDDCAAARIARAGGGKVLLLKTDAVVEGVHFDRRATPFQIGWKAMARPLSDIAAMAGQPRWALVTAGLRENLPVRFVREIYRGMTTVAGKFGVTIVGGETVRTTGPFWFSVALAGEVDKRRLRLRSTARAGDAILVTGALGGSIHGKHLTFTPRIVEARWLARFAVAAVCDRRRGARNVGGSHRPPLQVHAMIDISDGLARDLGHICRESGVGARLEAPAIPVAPAAAGSLSRVTGQLREGRTSKWGELPSSPGVLAQTSGRAWKLAPLKRLRCKTDRLLSRALNDGEDYELLFTVPAAAAQRLMAAWRRKFPRLPLTPIGTIVRGSRIALVDARGQTRPVNERGYDHFQRDE